MDDVWDGYQKHPWMLSNIHRSMSWYLINQIRWGANRDSIIAAGNHIKLDASHCSYLISQKKTRERGQKMRIQSNNIQSYKNLRFSTANSLKRRIIRLSTAIDAITNGWLVFMYVRYPLLSNTINMKSTSLLLLLLLWLHLITHYTGKK